MTTAWRVRLVAWISFIFGALNTAAYANGGTWWRWLGFLFLASMLVCVRIAGPLLENRAQEAKAQREGEKS